MRATAGLHTRDAFRRERTGAREIFGVPFGVDVVGDGGDVVMLTQTLAQGVHQRGLAGTDRSAHTHAQRATCFGHGVTQLLNRRVYWFSCRMLARSARKVALPRSSSDA